MYYPRKLTTDLFYVGGNDRRLSRFENMFNLPQGVSYNSYVLLDEKTALFDGIDSAVMEPYFESVREILNGRNLDYFIIHHVEPDHCGSINGILREHPETKLVISAKGLIFLKQFYRNVQDEGIDYDKIAMIISENDTLDLGKHKLTFIAAPNVHWPEVMVSYDQTDQILFSADAFGSFKALDGYLFADQVNFEHLFMDEARRYYINIVGRHGAPVQKLLKKAANLSIKMICPLHGLCYRTPETINLIVQQYQTWSAYQPETNGVVIIYSSMYGNSLLVADILAGMLVDSGAKHVKVHDVSQSDIGEMIADLFRYSNAVIFGQNYNTELYPKMHALLHEAKILNFSNRKISYIASMSWGGRGLAIAKELIDSCKGMEEIGTPVTIKSSIAKEQMEALKTLAEEIVQSLNQ